MKIAPFKLERYFAKYEFTAEYLLCASDCQGLEMNWLLEQADKECLDLWRKLTLGYTESQGLPLLRKEITQLYTGVGLENIIVVSGPEEGIFITLNSLLEPGDHIITTWPAYQSLYSVAQAIGCEVTQWPLIEKQGWRLNLPFLEKTIKKNTKLVVVNFPHNPTGFLPSRWDFNEIIRLIRSQGIYLLSDEVYRYLEYNPKRRLPAAVEIYPKAVSLSGMSKSFALAGLRIGWIISQDKELLDKIACFKDYTTICSSAPSEILSIIALRAKDEIIKRNLELINKNRALFSDYFIEFLGELFRWFWPEAGTVFSRSFLRDLLMNSVRI